MAPLRHWGNVQRLLAGKERRLGERATESNNTPASRFALPQCSVYAHATGGKGRSQIMANQLNFPLSSTILG